MKTKMRSSFTEGLKDEATSYCYRCHVMPISYFSTTFSAPSHKEIEFIKFIHCFWPYPWTQASRDSLL